LDRRKRKTREAIFQACIDLMKEKDFQQITINELVKKADLNRGTFYLHFVDKYDMIESFENEMIDYIKEVILNSIPKENDKFLFIESRYDTIVGIIKCFQENKLLFQFIINSGYYNSFQEKLKNELKVILEDNLFPIMTARNINIPIELFLKIFSNTGLILAEYACDENAEINPDQLAKFFLSIIVHGPTRTLGILGDEDIQRLSIK